MKAVLILILSLSFTLNAFGQTITDKIDFNEAFALGEIDTLPDTIIIFKNYNQLQSPNTYTRLIKTKSNNYHLIYGWREKGCPLAADPVLYNYDLTIKFANNNTLKLKFGKKVKNYYLERLLSRDQQYYKLTIKK